MEYGVTIQIAGEDVFAGTLYANVRRGIETASFRCATTYLADGRAFPLAPDMPLVDGAIHTQGESLFRVFGDCMPDRWGRNLMLRAERRLAREEVVAEAHRVARVLARWRKVATANGIARASIEHMASCMEHGVSQLESVR